MFIAENIRYLRKKWGYSQDDLANVLGYSSFTTIQKWESGVSTPPLGIFAKMSDLFAVSMDDMVKIDLASADAGTGSGRSFDYYTLKVEEDLISGEYSDGDIIRLEARSPSSGKGSGASYMRLCIHRGQMLLQPVDDTFCDELSAFDIVNIMQVLRRKK